MSLPTQARIGSGAFSAFGTPTLGSLKVARTRMSVWGYRKVSNFITRRSHLLALGRLDFPRPTISLAFRVATARDSRFFSTP
jgi:hypothetical protein